MSKTGQEYTTFLPPSDIREALNKVIGSELAGKVIRGEKPVITSCGSGMTAGVLWLGLRLVGAPHVSLYDEVCDSEVLVRIG